jgi:hypothetical protein
MAMHDGRWLFVIGLVGGGVIVSVMIETLTGEA